MSRFRPMFVAACVGAVMAPTAAFAVVADRPVTSFPDFNGNVRAIAHRGSTIYVGGDFSSVSDSRGTYRRAGAAAIDRNTGRVLPWRPNVNGEVHDLAVGREGVYLVGDFSAVKGQARRDFARVSLGGQAGLHRVQHRTNGVVKAVALSKRRIYIGGAFTAADGKPRARLAAFGRGAPSRLLRWSPKAEGGQVTDLVIRRQGVYVAGYFERMNNNRNFGELALVTERRGRVVRSFNPATPKPLRALAVTRRRVFGAEGGDGGGGVLAVQRRDGDRVFRRRFDGDVQAITAMRGQVYAGGHFSAICADGTQSGTGDCLNGSVSRKRGASLDARTGRLTGWDPDANGRLGILALDRYARAEVLLAGGDFTTTNNGGSWAGRFALFR